MKRRDESGTTSLRALAIFIAIGVVAHAGLPYLPLVGPRPLRPWPVKPLPAVKIETAVLTSPTNTLTVVGPPLIFPSTNSSPAAGVNLLASPPPRIGNDPVGMPDETFGASIFGLPPSDAFSVTPQMLAAYFHPGERGTNRAAIVGPIPIGFVPPLAQPVKSSHAEYIVK